MSLPRSFLPWSIAALTTAAAIVLGVANIRLRVQQRALFPAGQTAAASAPAPFPSERPATTSKTLVEAGVAAPDSPPVTREAGRVDGPAAIRALWQDPGFRAASIAKAASELEGRYGRFFLTQLSGLTPDERERIKVLLATQSVDLALAQLPLVEPESAGDTARRLAAVDALQREQDVALRSALGEPTFEAFQRARQAESYRDTVATLANGMRSQGFAVDDLQQEKILAAYTGAMVELGEALGREPLPPAATPEQRRQRREAQILRMNLILARTMRGVLEGPALDAFLASQLERDL